MAIVVGGRLLAESYWGGADAGTTRDVASAQKSITSALIGRAQRDGSLDVEEPVSRWLGAGWTNATTSSRAPIRIRNLLAMDSGLDTSLNPVDVPGRTWLYNTPAYARLHDVLEAATSRDLAEYSQEVLFDPIGMTTTRWLPRGTTEIGSAGGAERGLETTTRDMARFGLLTRSGGQWAEAEIVPAPFVALSRQPSQPMNPSYGWLWWLNGEETVQLPVPEPTPRPGPLIPTAPDDLVMALGAGGHRIYVVPSLDLVVARQSDPAVPGKANAFPAFDLQLWKLLTAAAQP